MAEGCVAIEFPEFDKQRETAIQKAKDEYGDDDTTTALWQDISSVVEMWEITDSGDMSISFSNDIGYFLVEFPIEEFMMTQMMEHIIKRINKMKTAMEALK